MRMTHAILMLLVLAATAAAQTGNVFHQVIIRDDYGELTPSTVEIYVPGTTTRATIYKDKAQTLAITQPITSASTNTTLSGARLYWYGQDSYDYKVTTTYLTQTNTNAPSLNASDTFIDIHMSLGLDNELYGFSEIDPNAQDVPYWATTATMSSAPSAAYGRTLWNDANSTELRATIGAVIGTDVEAHDPNLTAISGLTTAADKLLYWTGAAAAALCDITAYARTILDDANAGAARTTLGVVIGTDVEAHDPNLTAISGLTTAANKAIYWTGAGAAALYDLTVYARTLLDDANAADARTTLGVVIGTDVQAYDSDLDLWKLYTPTTFFGGLASSTDANNLRPDLELPHINVKDYPYLADGNGVTDDTAAIQAAIDAAGGTQVVFVPEGTYLITSDLIFDDSGFSIEGAGKSKTVIRAASGVTKIFDLGSTAISRALVSNLCLDGNDVATYGIYGTATRYSTFRDVRITRTTTTGAYMTGCWGNRWINCTVRGNSGDGIDFPSGANGVAIIGCDISDANGFGLKLKTSYGVDVVGSLFEQNDDGAIFVTGNVRGFNVQGCYFEANSQTGYTFTTPAVNVQADIILNGGASTTTMSCDYPAEGVSITGCFVSNADSYNQDCFIYGPGLVGADISANVLHTDKTLVLFEVPWSSTYASLENIHLRANSNWTATLDANTPTGIVRFNSSDQFRIEEASQGDRADHCVDRWTVGDGNDPNVNYAGMEVINAVNLPVWSLMSSDANSTAPLYFSLDSADYPELVGKLCAFSAYVKGDTTMAANLYVAGTYATASYESDPNWTRKIHLFAWPESGTLNFGVRKIGAAGTVYVAGPMLYEFGADWNALYAKRIAGQVHATGISVSNSTSAGYARFYEDSDNDVNYVTVKAAEALTTDNEILTLDDDAATYTGYFRATTATYLRYYHVPLYSANPGASGATFVPPDANRVGGWDLDAATEYLYGQTDVHADWSADANAVLEVRFCNNAAGTDAGDTVDIKAIFTYKGVGEDTVKTQTVEEAVTIGVCDAYKQFEVELELDYDLAGNVLEVGDIIAVRVNIETDTSEVDDITLSDMSFYYTTTHSGIEAGDG